MTPTRGPQMQTQTQTQARAPVPEEDVLEFPGLGHLPPLSPTIELAFCEAFADMTDEKGSDGKRGVKVEPVVGEEEDGGATRTAQSPSPAAETFVEAAASPSPAAMASAPRNQERRQDDVMKMSPGETKRTAASTRAEEKRARRSAIEKKSRQRRQGVLRRMRDEVKQLEDVYASALAEQDDKCEALNPVEAEELQHKYSQLSLVAHALEEDQKTLQDLLQRHEQFRSEMQTLADQDDRLPLEGLDGLDVPAFDTGDLPSSSSLAVPVRRLSAVECYAIVRESYEMIQRFDSSRNFESTGANILGWTDKRKFDETSRKVQFAFAKSFPLEDAEVLLMRSWAMNCNAESMQKVLFGSSIPMRFEIVQRLNDDLVIIRRDNELPNMQGTFLTVHMVFRLQTPNGFMLCMRTIPAPEIRNALEPHEYFYDVFHWSHFIYRYDEDGCVAGCDVEVGGSIEGSLLMSKYWVFEVMVNVLRWESMCIAPVFLKQM